MVEQMIELPGLTEEIDAALRSSIEMFGVIVPVVYNRGDLIDGHNRTRLAAELGVTVPRIDLDIEPEQADLVAVELNTARRQMTQKVRRKIVKSLIEAGYSQRATAKAVGVGETTVRRDVAGAPGGAPQVPDRSTGLDGKSYPTKRPAPKTEPQASVPDGRPKKRAAPRAEPGPAKNDREAMRANALNERFQKFIGVTKVSTTYFGEADFNLLVKAMSPAEMDNSAEDLAEIAASCRKLVTRLKEAQNASQQRQH